MRSLSSLESHWWSTIRSAEREGTRESFPPTGHNVRPTSASNTVVLPTSGECQCRLNRRKHETISRRLWAGYLRFAAGEHWRKARCLFLIRMVRHSVTGPRCRAASPGGQAPESKSAHMVGIWPSTAAPPTAATVPTLRRFTQLTRQPAKRFAVSARNSRPFPHGLHVDRDGNVWVTDAVVSKDHTKGEQVGQAESRWPGADGLGTVGVSGGGPTALPRSLRCRHGAQWRHLCRRRTWHRRTGPSARYHHAHHRVFQPRKIHHPMGEPRIRPETVSAIPMRWPSISAADCFLSPTASTHGSRYSTRMADISLSTGSSAVPAGSILTAGRKTLCR